MKILIISGAGFLAGANLYIRFVKKLHEKIDFRSDGEYPEVVFHSYPFSEIDESGKLGENIKKELDVIFNSYKDDSFDYVILACNTMHLIEIGRRDNVNLISLPSNALSQIYHSNVFKKKGLVLCSNYAAKKNLFDSKHVYYPNDELRKVCDRWIAENIHKKYVPTKKEIEVLRKEIVENNYSHLIIGCTELSEIDWLEVSDLCKVIDSSHLAVEMLTNKVKKDVETKREKVKEYESL